MAAAAAAAAGAAGAEEEADPQQRVIKLYEPTYRMKPEEHEKYNIAAFITYILPRSHHSN